MRLIRRMHLGLIAFFLSIALACPLPSQAFDDELTGEHLEPLLPESVGGFMLENVNVENNRAGVRAVYQSETESQPIALSLAYGEDAAQLYRQLRAQIVMAEAEVDELSVHDRTFAVGQLRSDYHAFSYSDHFLVVASYQDLDADADVEELKSSISGFLEAFDLNRLQDWMPPEGVEYALDENVPSSSSEVANCYDMECFGEYVSRCEKAQMVGALGRRVTVLYTVEEQTEANQCRLSFVFTDNPNPDFEGPPMYFTMNPDDGFSEDEVRSVMEECFEGDGEAHNCEGPLLEQMKDNQ